MKRHFKTSTIVKGIDSVIEALNKLPDTSSENLLVMINIKTYEICGIYYIYDDVPYLEALLHYYNSISVHITKGYSKEMLIDAAKDTLDRFLQEITDAAKQYEYPVFISTKASNHHFFGISIKDKCLVEIYDLDEYTNDFNVSKISFNEYGEFTDSFEELGNQDKYTMVMPSDELITDMDLWYLRSTY